jgi:hypothetical protein
MAENNWDELPPVPKRDWGPYEGPKPAAPPPAPKPPRRLYMNFADPPQEFKDTYNYYRTPFDPPDPYSNEMEARRGASLIMQNQDPRERIPASFAATRIEDRTGPGRPGSFLDTGEWGMSHNIGGSPYNTPKPDLTYDRRYAVQPKPEDLRNPLSMDLGIRSIASPQEMVISRIIKMMQDKGKP